MKKLVALLLCLVMFGGLLVAQAFAAEGDAEPVDFYAWYARSREAYYEDVEEKAEESTADGWREEYEEMLRRYLEAIRIYEQKRQAALAISRQYDAVKLAYYNELVAEYEALKVEAARACQEYENARAAAWAAAQQAMTAAEQAYQRGEITGEQAYQQAEAGVGAAVAQGQAIAQGAIDGFQQSLNDYEAACKAISEDYARRLQALQEQIAAIWASLQEPVVS